LSSPAVWQGETLIAAPLAGFNDAWEARIVADFHTCLLSH
jgi:tRNA(Ile)-lysidine synthase